MSTESIFHTMKIETTEEAEEFINGLEKAKEMSKNIIPKSSAIKKNDEWRTETCWDELRKSLD